MTQNIAIIGGGIAGLALAAFYKKLGGRVDIYEKKLQSSRDGLGFIMLENGVKALSHLGLESKIKNFGFILEECQILDNNGSPLIQESLRASFGVTRKAFIDALLSQIPNDWLHFDHYFSHFEWDKNNKAKTAVFDNGVSVNADLFIGCDGAHSAVRTQIFPESSRSQVKVKELVSIVENPALVASLNKKFTKYKSLDGGLAVGILPVDKEKLIWFIQFDVTKHNFIVLSEQGKRIFAKNIVEKWPAPLAQLIRETNFNHSHLSQSSYLNPIERFHKENVILIGDAAHALLPFTSQGVNSAIEDATELANILYSTQSEYLSLALDRFFVTRKKIIAQYLDQGIKLQDEFLRPHQADQKIPFAF
ncbi:FAD-dependent monooxygenase [Aliikangiella coralliicola]|uniref:FAD-binding domain-containing protein n=1 Tax=Aliikangiella coralliicola TaxID=2592383 RepID=A0A545U7F3_9GAMM|nr:FAD-dependent monooxygenase [Aliikangiella coralliicola]TQV85398.1 hypothetical protein FLL46_19725 [Aliikangiella coralliicola]